MPEIDEIVLKDYVATANNPEYKGDYSVINSKFPELEGVDPQVLKDYVATANNPEYKNDYSIINSKFPEFFEEGVKKKDESLQSPGTSPGENMESSSQPTAGNASVDGGSSQTTPRLELSEEAQSNITQGLEAMQDNSLTNSQDGMTNEQRKRLGIYMDDMEAVDEREISEREAARKAYSERKANEIDKGNRVDQALGGDPNGSISMMDKRYSQNSELDLNKDGVIDIEDSKLEDARGGMTRDEVLSGKVDQVYTENPEIQAKKELQKTIKEEYKNRIDQTRYINEQERLTNKDKILKLNDIYSDEEQVLFDAYNAKLAQIEEDSPAQLYSLAQNINQNFGVNGIVAFGLDDNGFTLTDINGNLLEVTDPSDTSWMTFLEENGELKEDIDPDKMSYAQKQAVKFYADRGYNYFGVNNITRNQQNLIDKVDMIEDLVSNRDKTFLRLTPEDKKNEVYKDLFFENRNGVLVPKTNDQLYKIAEETEVKIDKLNQVVGYASNFNDSKLKDVSEEFDIYVDQMAAKTQAEAADINKSVIERADQLDQEMNKRFGGSIYKLDPNEVIKTENDLNTWNSFIQRSHALQWAQKDAASKYLDAATFYDMKFDENVTQASKDNWEGIKGEIAGGYDKSQAGDIMMQYAMGLTGKSKQEVAEVMAAQLRQAETRNRSAGLRRFTDARGFDESAAAYLRDPGEILVALVGSSMSQMASFGMKIVPTSVAAGTAIGAGYGAMGFNPVTVAGGAVSGGIQGFRVGMALSMFAMEYNNAVIDAARNHGYDILKAEDWEKALGDERVWDEGMEIGLKRGVPIAVVDYLTAGLAGKTFGVSKRAFSSPLKRVGLIAVEQGVYGPGAEMLGETLAMISAGQELDGKEILMEGMGGFGNNSVNLAIETAKVTSKNAKLKLAEDLTNINKMMNESAKDKTILKFANKMKETGQIDENTYSQIEENLSARRTAEEYIQTGNPELVVQEDAASTEVTTEENIEANKEGGAKASMDAVAQEEVQGNTTEEAATEEAVEEKAEAEQEIAEEVSNDQAPELANLERFKKVRGRKNKQLVKNRIASLVKARNYYKKNDETSQIFGPQISAINKEINKIVTSGKLQENPVKLPESGQKYKVGRREMSSDQFKKHINRLSDKKFEEASIEVSNPSQEIQELLNKRTNAIQESSTESVDVQESSKDGQTLVEGNTKEEVTQEGKEEVQVEKTQKIELTQRKGLSLKTKQPIKEGSKFENEQREVEVLGTIDRMTEKAISENKSPAQITKEVDTRILLTPENKKKVKRWAAERKTGKTNQTFSEWNGSSVQVETEAQVEVETKPKTESETKADIAVEAEAEVLTSQLGLTQKKGKGETKFSLTDETVENVDNETDIQAIKEVMESFDGSEIDFSEDAIIEEGSKPVKVNPIKQHKNKAKVIAKLKELGYNPKKVMTTIEQWGGIPSVFGISDTLAAGTVTDSMGNDMEVDGGLFFNIMSPGNEQKAWASVKREDDVNQTKRAIETYQKNKAFFDNWWKKNPDYAGHVPLMITRMGTDAIYSNEAAFRFYNPKIKSLPLKNREAALNVLLDRLTGKQDQGKKDYVFTTTGNSITVKADNLINANNKANAIAAKNNVKITSKQTAATKSAVKEGKVLADFIQNNNITTIDGLLDAIVEDSRKRAKSGLQDEKTLGLNFKTRLYNNLFPKNRDVSTNANPVIKELVKGLNNAKEIQQTLTTKNMYDNIAEPSVAESTQGSIIGVMGIEVANEKNGKWEVNNAEEIVTDTSHPNYATGPKGKLLAYITNPKHAANLLPEMRAKLGKLFKPGKRKAGETTTEQRRKVAKATATQSTSTFMGDTSFIGASLAAEGVSDVQLIIGALKQSFPSMSVTMTQEEFNSRINEPDVRSKISDGNKILGFVTKDGKIYLNPNKATLKTAIHEFGHVWVDYLKSTLSGKKGTEILKKGFSLIDGTSVYQKALKKYGEFDADGNLTNKELVLEEALVDAIAQKGENIKNAAEKAGFKSWLNGMYKYLQQKFKLSKNLTPTEIADLTLDEFTSVAMKDLIADTGTQGKKDFTTSSEVDFDVAFDSSTDTNTRFDTLGGLNADEIISEGRKRGFTEASIKRVVQDQFPKLTVEMINEKMSFNTENGQLNIFEQQLVPESFGNIDGGVEAGKKLYDSIARQLKKFGKEGPKTSIQMRQKALSILKNHPLYKQMSGNTTLQKQMQVDLDTQLAITKGKTLNETIKTLKKQINQRKAGQFEQSAIVKRIESILRQSLPKTSLVNSEVKAVMRILKNAKPGEFDAALNKAQELINKIENRLKDKALLNAFKRFKKLAQTKLDRSGKIKSKGKVDASGISFFKAASKVLKAFISDDVKTIESLEKKLFTPDDQGGGLSPALEKVISSIEQGQELTTDEQTLLNEYAAYDLIKDVNKMSLAEVEAMLGKFSSIESVSRESLAGKLLNRARENRILREEAESELESTYGETLYSGENEFTKLTAEEELTYEEKVLDAWANESNNQNVVEVDGKVFKVESSIDPKTKKSVETITIQRPLLKNKNELASEWPSLYKRVQIEKGKNNPYARLKATWDHVKNIGKRFGTKPALQVLNMAKNPVTNLSTLMKLMDSTTKGFFDNKVYKNLNRMFAAHKKGYYTQVDHMNDIANKIFGGKKGLEGVQKSKAVKKLYTLTMANGKTLNVFGPAAMRIYALSKNKTQRSKMINNNRGDFQFTEQTFKQLEDSLNEADPRLIELVDQTVEYLSNEYYESINNVYEDVNFVSLTKQDNYFPTKTDTTNSQRTSQTEAIAEGDFAKVFSAQYASGLKQRLDTSGQVQIFNNSGKINSPSSEIGFFGELNGHFDSMEKFKAYAPGVKEINTIFQSNAVKAALENAGTTQLLNTLMNYAVNPNAINEVTFEKNWQRKLFSRYSLAALGFKPIQTLKQASSSIAAFTDYKAGPNSNAIKDVFGFIYDLTKVMLTPRANIKKAKDMSAVFRDRLSIKDIAALEGFMQTEFSSRTLRRAQEMGGFFTRVGDVLGVLGYMANYNRDIANGMSQTKALEKFEAYNETQQSRRPQDMSSLQADKSIYKRALTLFGSSSILQVNQMLQGINDIVKKGIRNVDGKTWRRLAIQGSAVNATFMMAGNFLRFIYGDDEDLEEAQDELIYKYVLPTNMLETAFPLLGPSIGYSVDVASGMNPWDASKRRRTAISPLLQMFGNVGGAMSKGEYTKAVSKVLGLGLGINVDPFVGMIDYFKDDRFNEGDLSTMFGIGTTARPDALSRQNNKRIFAEGAYQLELQVKESDAYKAAEQLKKEAKQLKKDETIKMAERSGKRSF